MKTRLAIFLICPVVALSGFFGAVLASSLFRVQWVNDGDTVVLADGRRVRYVGINTPEVANKGGPAERFGPEARDYNQKLVHKEEVRLERLVRRNTISTGECSPMSFCKTTLSLMLSW